MRDLPVFTTENGVGSLILSQIPYLGCAYVRVQDASCIEAFLKECADLCRAFGAEHAYATADQDLGYPLFTSVILMQAMKASIPDTDAAVWPVQPETLSYWQKIYNDNVRKVPNGAWMTDAQAQTMLHSGGGYFVHKDGKLIGNGWVEGNKLLWVCSTERGNGASVVSALKNTVHQDTITLEVANINMQAWKLYERLGFVPVSNIANWYKIL